MRIQTQIIIRRRFNATFHQKIKKTIRIKTQFKLPNNCGFVYGYNRLKYLLYGENIS